MASLHDRVSTLKLTLALAAALAPAAGAAPAAGLRAEGLAALEAEDKHLRGLRELARKACVDPMSLDQAALAGLGTLPKGIYRRNLLPLQTAVPCSEALYRHLVYTLAFYDGPLTPERVRLAAHHYGSAPPLLDGAGAGLADHDDLRDAPAPKAARTAPASRRPRGRAKP